MRASEDDVGQVKFVIKLVTSFAIAEVESKKGTWSNTFVQLGKDLICKKRLNDDIIESSYWGVEK